MRVPVQDGQSDGSEFIGKEMEVWWQPYGANLIRIEEIERSTYMGTTGYGTVRDTEYEIFAITGTVIKGSTTSRLFQYTSTRDNAGTKRTERSLTRLELEKGSAIRVAM